jgi:hypothetical protein
MSWQLLEQYHDLIINGADLISFLLITPQLVQFIAPALSEISFALPLKVLTAFFFLFVFLFFTIALGTVARSGAAALVVVPFILVGTYMLIKVYIRVAKLIGRATSTTTRWFARNAFGFGALLFFISRMLAFTIAARQTLLMGQ